MAINKKLMAILVILVVALLVFGGMVIVKKREGNEAAAKINKAINFINNNMLQKGTTASLIDFKEESGLYAFRIKVGDREYQSYLTKDGKILFPSPGVKIDEFKNKQKKKAENVSDKLSKRDVPDVKLFIMSYCPFGLQAEKMFLPVYNLLKDKANMGIYFVDYAMHGKKEIDENLRQYCIQKEQKDKYADYLSCFLKEGKSQECLGEANIDETKLKNCISDTDKEYSIYSQYNDKSTWLNGNFPKFDVQSQLNKKYKVLGSPTLVINDAVIVTDERACPEGNVKCVVVSDFSRSPESFKRVVCQAFNSSPDECSQTLENTVFSPGFGFKTGSNNGGGGCGK